jgi:hypothetical protein
MTHGFVGWRLVWSRCRLVACFSGDFVSLSLLFGRNKWHRDRGEVMTMMSAVRPPSVNCCGCDDGGVRCLIGISCHLYFHSFLFVNSFVKKNERRQIKGPSVSSFSDITACTKQFVRLNVYLFYCLLSFSNNLISKSLQYQSGLLLNSRCESRLCSFQTFVYS